MSEFYWGFGLQGIENDNCIHRKFNDRKMIFFFQNGDFYFSQMATTPLPYPPSLTAYLTPPEGRTPISFHQNDRKESR